MEFLKNFHQIHLTSVAHQLLLPNFAELPNEFKTPPFIIVGSKFPAVKILETNDIVVVFPY